MGVFVPFGQGNTLRKGYVIACGDKPSYAVDKIKAIDSICEKDEDANEKMIALAVWMKNTYGSTMITALKTVLPVRQKVKAIEKKTISLNVSDEKAKEILYGMQKKHSAFGKRNWHSRGATRCSAR